MLALSRNSLPRLAPRLAPRLSAVRCITDDMTKKQQAEAKFFRDQERAALDALKAKLAQKKKPIDEQDEKVRLANILEKVGVRQAIREELSVELILWKHDEDLVMEYKKK